MRDKNDYNEKTAIEKIASGLEGVLNTKTIVGDPIDVQDATIVPLIEITCGMGIGDYEGKNAGGMGTRLTPVACLVVQNGVTKVIHIKNTDPLSKLIDLLPNLINDVMGQNDLSKRIKEETKKIEQKYSNLNNN